MTAALSEWNGSMQREPKSMNLVESILLPVDDMMPCRCAVPVARKLCELYGATLHVAYVGEQVLDAQNIPSHLGFNIQETQGVIFDQRNGEPGEVLNQLTRELPHPLIVMSTRIGHSVDKDRFGSVAESIFATKPPRMVLLAPDRGEKPWNVRRILLAHDGTPSSHPATAPAAELAQRASAEVIALHVATRGDERPGEPGSIPAPFYVDQRHHEWPAWAEEFMNRLVAAGRPPSSVHFKLVVTRGQAGSEVADVARERDADLVVMAWHGNCEKETSASRVVIQTSGCPVLLVYSEAD
jgi:nucleotide-binding universal stress UspA family protein